VYLLDGPSVARSVPADSLNVLDMAPTMAAIMGLPISPLWSGQAAVTRDGQSVPKVMEYPLPPQAGMDSDGIDDALKEKLRSIGYVR
jgi:hypothetical protein